MPQGPTPISAVKCSPITQQVNLKLEMYEILKVDMRKKVEGFISLGEGSKLWIESKAYQTLLDW